MATKRAGSNVHAPHVEGAMGRRTHDGPPRPRPTADNFRDDPLFPRIERAVRAILMAGKVVAPVDILIRLGWLTPERLGDWRNGRVPYLEKVLGTNLIKLSRALRILRMYAHTLNLKPSHTVYVRHGGGPRAPLRFSKAGEPNVEAAYARHFVWPDKGPFHMPFAEFEGAGPSVEALVKEPSAKP